MDTIHNNQRRLLWTTLIVLLQHYREVSGSGHECPQGQLLQKHLVNARQYITCCYPTRCGVGQEVKPCTANGTADSCQICGTYHNQSLRTSSFTMERCEYWPLDKECKSIDSPGFPRNTNDERTRRCMCNIEQGKKYDPPEFRSPGAPMDSYCQRRHDRCLSGHEPMVDGGCRPCKENYFKTDEGFRLCEPKTNCTMLGLSYTFKSASATEDNNCSLPDPITTPKPFVPEKAPLVTVNQKSSSVITESSVPTFGSTPDTGHRYDSSKDPVSEENNLLWPIIGTVVFFIALVASIAFIMFRRKRKGLNFCCGCGTSKDCADVEKDYSQGASSMLGVQRNKHGMTDICVIPQHLTEGNKAINNNISGGMYHGIGYLSNGHPNGGIPSTHLNHSDHGTRDTRPFYVSPHQYHLPTLQTEILRNNNHNAVYAQARGNMADRSIDSIGQEKLQVLVDELEANQDHDESDPLLVPERLRGVGPCQMQNMAALVGNSPPIMQAGVNPLQVLAYNNVGSPQFDPAFVHSGASSPPGQPHMPVVTYAPATGAVTFTRSTSVIASPEGEVDEDDIEARLPRLSQLLTEGDDASASVTGHSVRDVYRADSLGRETTQQLRAPSQRLVKDQYFSPRNGNQANLHIHRPGNQTAQQRPGFPPAVIGPVPQRGPEIQQPVHHIMNLKEQQLAESLHSTPSTLPANDRQLKSDAPATGAPKTVVASCPEEAQQTELKTQVPSAVDSDFSTGAHAKAKSAKAEQGIHKGTEPKQVDSGRNDHNLADRKRQVSGGSSEQNTLEKKHPPNGATFQNISDRKCVPSRGSDNMLERHGNPSSDQQRSRVKTVPPEDYDSAAKKHHRYNRTVSFEDEENTPLGFRHQGASSECRQSKSHNSPEKVAVDSRYKGPLRSVSDPDQKCPKLIGSDDEETERKCVSLEYSNSMSSSKASVNSDLSGSDCGSSSPYRSAQYRRSQSENAPGSSDSCHKPPPRSMSEEKPQKLDRPIAKVKPMPASDNTINQLSVEVSDDTDVVSQPPADANSGATIFGYSSNDSDIEHDSETSNMSASALEEDEETREAEDELEENGV